MPLFTEGQDPLDQGSQLQPAGRMPTGLPEPPPFSGPSSNAIVGAAFRQSNPVVSVLDAITRSRPDMTPVPGYDPVQRLSGTKDDDLIEQSLADVNPAQTDARIAKKQAEQKDQETLAASGWAGTAASIAAGALDPSWFIPIAGELRAGAEAGLVARAARGAVEGAVKSTVSETALQASQVTRTPGESAGAIATNTLLMGLIGGGMGMLERGERATAAEGLDKVRTDLSPVRPPDTPVTEAAIADQGVRPSEPPVGTSANLTAEQNSAALAVPGHPEPMVSEPSLFRAGENMSLAQALDRIPLQDHPNEAVMETMRTVREQIKKLVGDVPVNFVSDEAANARKGVGTAVGAYNETRDRISINADYLGRNPDSNAVMHEALHAALGKGLDQRPELKSVVRSLMGEFRIALAEQQKAHLRETDFARAFQDEHEFLSEALSRPDMQDIMSKSRVQLEKTKQYADPAAWTGRVQTVWRSLIDTVRQILGMPARHTSQLEALLRVTDEAWFRGEQARGGAPSRTGAVLVPDHEVSQPTLTRSLSAAEADQRTMKLARIMLPENFSRAISETPVIGPAYDWSAATLMRFSPTLRIFSSDSLAAKRAMGDLAETSLRFTQSEQGITTAQGGIPIDRIVKMQTNKGRMDTAHILRDAFVEYRGLEDKAFPLVRSGVQDFRGQAAGKMSFDDFKTEVALAASNGDTHPVPQVAAAASKIRAQVLEPIKKMAQRVLGPDGKPMLGEELEAPKGDKSFFPRSWNKQAIAGRYNDAKKVFADWLENDQAMKSAAKDRLQLFNDALQSHENSIAKIEMKLQGRSEKLEELTDRQEEIQRLNRFAYQRAETLRTAERRRIENARGGAIFETQIRNRGNTLADQASGKSAEIDALERRLIQETENAKAMRAKIEKEIADWQGQSASEAKTALKARAEAEKAREQKMAEGTYEGKGERLTGADGAVDRAVKSILNSDRALSREELENRAAEIINRINVAPDGRLAYEAGGGGEPIPTGAQQVRGSLNARDFAIPTHLVKDFIHTDAEHIIAGHLRSTIPDIHLTDRFGDVDMTDVFRRVNEEYDQKLAGAGARQSVKIDNERKAMVRDLAATRDRIRAVYGFDLAKSQPNTARIANAARNWNLIADLGTSVFNRLTDATNATWRHGLMNVFNDGYRPFLASMLGSEAGGAARQSMKDMGVGIDSHLGHMSHQWGDVIENYLPGSKFERAMSWAADKSMMVNLHGPWTDGIKTVAGTVAAADFLRMAQRVSFGQQTAHDVQRLAQAGIAPHMAERIWTAYKDGGGEEFGKGTHVANTADWKDTHARDVFTAAIGRDADLAVLTPGLEKPLWMSGPVVSLLGQYKSFVAAAHEKILISNLQQMDGRTLQGLVAAIGMGMLSYRAYTLWSGAPTSDRPQDWIKEGISRSAIGGWYTELNSIQAKFTGGNTDAFRMIGADHPLSRRQSNSALSELLGPTYSRLEGIAGGINDASHGTWTAMDTHKVRQAMWLQNLFVTRRLFDSVEDGFNEAIGVKSLNRDPSQWPGAPVH